jgi:hypothetical protein
LANRSLRGDTRSQRDHRTSRRSAVNFHSFRRASGGWFARVTSHGSNRPHRRREGHDGEIMGAPAASLQVEAYK